MTLSPKRRNDVLRWSRLGILNLVPDKRQCFIGHVA